MFCHSWPTPILGNISKEICCMPSSHATILIRYLPIGNFECFNDKNRKVMHYQTFHTHMSFILRSLITASEKRVLMACADNKLHQVWPVVTAYIANYPEQCLVACCMENWYPIGHIPPALWGSHQPCKPRSKEKTLHLLKAYECGTLSVGDLWVVSFSITIDSYQQDTK